MGAFSGCVSLREIALPDTLTAIRRDAFLDCPAAREEGGFRRVGRWILRRTGESAAAIVPEDAVGIAEGAFSGHAELVTLRLPRGLRHVGGMAFHGCAALTEAVLPPRLETVGGYAFAGCAALNRITIPHSVRTVGEGAFSGCVRLREIRLGPDTAVGPGAFKGCPGTPEIIRESR